MDGYLPISDVYQVIRFLVAGQGAKKPRTTSTTPWLARLQLDGGVPWREIDMIKKHTLTPQRKRSGLWSGADLNVATSLPETTNMLCGK